MTKLVDLEAQVRLLKTALKQGINFDIDEKNWRKMKPVLKRNRKRLFKNIYG